MKQLWLIGLFVAAITAPAGAKPQAPVAVTLEVVPASGGYRVTLVAVPTRAVPRLELVLAGERRVFGATAAGRRRTLAVTVPLARGAGRDVVGWARAAGRTRAAAVRLGTPRAAPRRPVVRRLPDGRVVGEVR